MPIFNIVYATVQLQTFPTKGRATFYLIPSRHLFNPKWRLKRRVVVGLYLHCVVCTYGVATFFFHHLRLNFDEESIGDDHEAQKILFFWLSTKNDMSVDI